ncbi:alpha/beta fold hydrolase [Nocardioides speluncae]|uniref:alpha/beta fold hydrolase n=1 Tax=Nocardioides speluncae TaxID=2670337 RepID=UPI000D69E87D|nr:alpha/beta hydrolase [Nocardioides speluncae]
MTTPLLLLSGAGLPAWIWDDVRAQLPVETRVVEYPRGSASLAEYAAAAAATADGWESYGVVAHSLGGVVGSELLAQQPERVTGFFGVSAIIPAAGSSFLGALPSPQRHVVSLAMRLMGTRPPAKSIRSGLAAGLTAEQADRIVADFDPESQRVYRDPVSPRVFPEVRRYLLTTGDKEFPESLQQKYAAEIGGPVDRLDTAHLPMLEQPKLVAELVESAYA